MIVPGRVSIVWPYWQRGEAMLAGLRSMRECYDGKLDLEIVVVDDGSPTNRARPALENVDAIAFNRIAAPLPLFPGGPMTGLQIHLVELPIKDGPLNPCVPINRGVAASSGEFIVLTNPETTHRSPVLIEMKKTIERLGRAAYVLAGVYCPEVAAWHCHSEFARAGYHFCTMLHRDLWDLAGGFDEDYRPGYCFDDPDFVQRLIRAGARFVFRDDLVVDHHQTEEAKHWRPRADWDMNRALYDRKWPNPKSHDGAPVDEATLQNWKRE